MPDLPGQAALGAEVADEAADGGAVGVVQVLVGMDGDADQALRVEVGEVALGTPYVHP